MKKVVLISVAVICLCSVFIGLKFMNETKIREIPDVEDWVWSYDGRETVVKCYLIHNPPADYDELKMLAQKHIDDNITKIISPDDENIRYKCFFYRTSYRLPWNWEEDHGYLSEDHIEHHADDMIVAVYWTPQEPMREYHIMKKSKKYNTYGDLIEEVRYKGDSQGVKYHDSGELLEEKQR